MKRIYEISGIVFGLLCVGFGILMLRHAEREQLLIILFTGYGLVQTFGAVADLIRGRRKGAKN